MTEVSDIAKELLLRRSARQSLSAYVGAIEVPGRPADANDDETETFLPIETKLASHHELLNRKLEECSSKRHGRLMVFMPPGSAKSTYASVVFPSFFLGKNANSKIILASYGDDLARKMGRRTRSIVKQERYKKLWNTALREDSKAVTDFALQNGSEYMACGILAGVTGNRANGIIIDDPVKGREQADSKVIRDKIYEAYESDLKTRIIPGGWIVLIQTRWHEDDLAGRILPPTWKGESGPILCTDNNVWEVICLQAQCELPNDPLGRKTGEFLWPEWFDQKHWAQFMPNLRNWSALYQQLPAPPGGLFFQTEMLGTIEAIPPGTKFIRSWDLASTEGGGDFTAGPLLGELPDGRFVIADMVRGQWGPHNVEKNILVTAMKDGNIPISLPKDPGQAGSSQVIYLTGRLAGYTVKVTPTSGNKETRAGPLASQMNVGNMVMLKAPWNKALLEELKMFPNGKYDDQVDSLSDGMINLTTRKTVHFGTL